jgi:acyl-CoA thioester hydrolase
MKEFTVEIPLRWGDMDVMRHLNNVQYFRLMEEARIQWFAAFGFSTLPAGEAPILAHVSCDFVRAMTYPAVAVVKQNTTRVGRSSLEMTIEIESKDEPGRAYATGKAVIVWYDYQANRSAPWPETIRQRLASG